MPRPVPYQPVSPNVTCLGAARVDMEAEEASFFLRFKYQGVEFHVLASAEDKDHPVGYDFEQSIEGKILQELGDLEWEDDMDGRDETMNALQHQLLRLAEEAAFPLIRELGPDVPVPEPRTLQEQLYPQIHVLQILTENGTLAAHRLEGYPLRDRHRPIPESKLQEQGGLGPDIPVFNASHIVMGERIQRWVWLVDVAGEKMICKVSAGSFFNIIGDELATYQKLEKAKVSFPELRVPELKGKY